MRCHIDQNLSLREKMEFQEDWISRWDGGRTNARPQRSRWGNESAINAAVSSRLS